MKKNVYEISIELTDEQLKQLAALEALNNLAYGVSEPDEYLVSVGSEHFYADFVTKFLTDFMRHSVKFDFAWGFQREFESERNSYIFSLCKDDRGSEVLPFFRAHSELLLPGESEVHILSEVAKSERYLMRKREQEAGDVPTRNLSSDEATPDEAAPDEAEAEPETVSNAEEEAPGDRESEPEDEEDFLTLAPLPCSYPHDRTVQYTPYDPALYENDAYECGSTVVDDPEVLAFVDALSAVPCR